MPDQSFIQSIVSGQQADQGRQRMFDLATDLQYGYENTKLEKQDQQLSYLADILAKQQAITGMKSMAGTMQKPPTNPDGSIDYKSLARMVLPYNPELAMKYDQESANSDAKKAKAAKDSADAQAKITKQAGDIINGVSDQTSLDTARSQLQKIPGFALSPNFPTQYNADTAKWLRSYGNAFVGASGKLDQASKEAEILQKKASAAKSFADAKETNYKADIARINDSRAKQGLGPLSASTPTSEWNPEDMDYWVDRYRKTGQMPSFGFDKNARASFMKAVSEAAKKEGASASDDIASAANIKSTGSALTNVTKDLAAITPYKEMLDKNVDIAKDLSEKVLQTNSKLANKSLNWLKQNAADNPDTSEYLAQMRFVQTEAARVLNNPRLVGQLSDSARKEMEDVVSGDMPLNSTARVLDRIKQDGENRVSALQRERDRLQKQLGADVEDESAPSDGWGQVQKVQQ